MSDEENKKVKQKLGLKSILKNKVLNLNLIKEDIDNLNNENHELKESINNKTSENVTLKEDTKLLSKEKQKLKEEVESLFNKNIKLKENLVFVSNQKLELEAELSKIKNTLIIKKKLSLIELEELINDKQQQSKLINERIELLNSDLIDVEERVYFEEFGLYKPKYDFANSSIYKQELNNVRNEQKKMIKGEYAVLAQTNWTVDGSLSKGRKMTNDNIKLMLRGFNNECEVAINKVSYKNLETSKKRIHNSFKQINNLNKVNACEISQKYLAFKLKELILGYEYARKKEEEREEMRIEKQKEREERALQKEVEEKRKVIDKEIEHLKNIILELEIKLDSAQSNDERDSIHNQINELKKDTDKYEKEREENDYRLKHSNAGYVYIISNIGSFGKNIYKIGVTRRLNPWERITELSSASVPFKFDTHALIFSYEAYKLETELHNKFSSKRVNLVNNRKEFFRLSMEEFKDELKQYENLTIDFTEEIDAEEYFETLQIIELENIER